MREAVQEGGGGRLACLWDEMRRCSWQGRGRGGRTHRSWWGGMMCYGCGGGEGIPEACEDAV